MVGCTEEQGLSGLCKPSMIPSILTELVSFEQQVGPCCLQRFLEHRFKKRVLKIYGCSPRPYTFNHGCIPSLSSLASLPG